MITFDKLTIRRYQARDRADVISLHTDALRSAVGEVTRGEWDHDLDDIKGNYLQNGGDFLVGHADGQLIAMGAYRQLSATTAEMKRIRVRPDCQGHGIGTHLLVRIEQEIQRHGYRAVELDTTDRMLVAQRLYERHGYIKIRTEQRQGLPFLLIYYRKVFPRDPA